MLCRIVSEGAETFDRLSPRTGGRYAFKPPAEATDIDHRWPK